MPDIYIDKENHQKFFSDFKITHEITPGIYTAIYMETDSTDPRMGISKNSNQLTTNFASITESHKWLFLSGSLETASRAGYLAAGDVLRVHGDGTSADTDPETKLIIERLF